MGQILVRKLDDAVKERLRERAKRNGRTLEAEARAVLEAAAQSQAAAIDASRFGWGTRLAKAQKNSERIKADWEAFDAALEHIRRERVRVIDFGEP